jgi:hypothetical protein
VGLSGLQQAFDEARFGTTRTLNLRQRLPTADEAARSAEAWLRQQQASGVREVLIITGRGNNSEGGVSRVREAVLRVMHGLTKKGVVASHQEHTPGSFVVELAPFRASIEAATNSRTTSGQRAVAAAPPSLAALDEETRTMLRDLAERALDALGVEDQGPFIHEEMLRQFSALVAQIGDAPDRERTLRDALRVALDRLE